QAQVQSQLRTYMYYRFRLETGHSQVMREHADGSWVATVEAATLNHLAREALQKLWLFLQGFPDRRGGSLWESCLDHCDHGRCSAKKYMAKAASHGSTGMRLMKQKKASALILD
ncbi:MAG: hypothetical protein ACKPKO_46270, partial [Candidatus Fonsibacter sp.]